MKVGIDFGTTYTKIAYVDERGDLQLFPFPGPAGQHYIPTTVSYRQGGEHVAIGEAALTEALNYPDVELVRGFKMFLPAENPKACGWTCSKSPTQVVRDYFEQLLRKAGESFERVHGDISSAVVSVPEVWQRTPTNRGAEALRRVLIDEMGLPVDRLQSEPVCAAAYFVHEYRRRGQTPDEFHLLVCDVGGGTFDVALCRVRGTRIDVVDFDGNSEEGLGRAGVCFDHNAVNRAYAEHHGDSPSPEELLELLEEFEKVKITSHGEVAELVEQLTHANLSELRDVPLYRFKRKYTLTLEQAMESFEPVAQGIKEVLARLKARLSERRVSIDRVAIVGGFGQFPLVQRTILESLGIRSQGDPRFDRTLHTEFGQFFAIAYGAALISAGLIQPTECYPHSLLIEVARLVGPELRRGFLPITEAGRTPAGQERPVFAEDGRRRVSVRVIRSGSGRLPVFIKLNGTGQPLALEIPPVDLPEPGDYYVGVKIDRSNMGTLVFESLDGRVVKEYRMGNINPVIIVEGSNRGA
jgi:molecular chaperone DnaK